MARQTAGPGRYEPLVAVLIPCRNEEATIGAVVGDFRRALPEAVVFVYDNASGDRTGEVAKGAGAIVRRELYRGKGNVVRRMFADVEADVYVLVDGDDTYDASRAPKLAERLVGEKLDMVSAARASESSRVYPPGHQFGNRMLTGIVGMIFGRRFDDMLTGYRVFSRRFVKSFPGLTGGFEIETELTIHALELRMPVDEIYAPYRERPAGSSSKLQTFRDGWKILRTILLLVKDERPLPFFSVLSGVLVAAAIAVAIPILLPQTEDGLVPGCPTAILAMGMTVSAFLSLASGVILESVTRARREAKRMKYLEIPIFGRLCRAAEASQ